VTCREFADFMMSYLDGELDAATRAAFEQHLTVCRNCVEYLHQYRQTIAAGRLALAGDAPVPDDVPEELIQAILAARRNGEGLA
jgi:anti-sigma factor RsiW